MEDMIIENEISKKKLPCYLLYGQALELHRLYYQELGIKHLTPLKKYYLIDKKWLDEYKIANEYNSVLQDAEQYQYDDYNTFKSKIMSRLKKNSQKKSLKIDSPKLEQGLIQDYNILFPKNFVPVIKEIFSESFLNYTSSNEVIIGEKNIFIFDNESQKENSKTDNIFICSIQFNEDNDDITDFHLNVDEILILYKNFAINEKKFFFKCIQYGFGIKNYYKVKGLNDKSLGEQFIYDEIGQNVGVYYRVRNTKNPEEDKINEAFLIEYVNKKYPEDKRFTNIVLGAIGNESLNENIIQAPKKAKCITIKGNLYEYFNNNYENNCFISECKQNI